MERGEEMSVEERHVEARRNLAATQIRFRLARRRQQQAVRKGNWFTFVAEHVMECRKNISEAMLVAYDALQQMLDEPEIRVADTPDLVMVIVSNRIEGRILRDRIIISRVAMAEDREEIILMCEDRGLNYESD